MAAERFRVGRHLGRTIYRVVNPGQPSEQDVLIGMMDTPELGAITVQALNELAENGADVEGLSQRDLSIPQTCQDADGQQCEPSDCKVNGPHYVTHPPVPLRSPFGTVEPPRRGRT